MSRDLADSPVSGPPAVGRRLLVIRNPVAGRRHGGRFARIMGHLWSLGCKVTVIETRFRGDAEAIAAEIDPDTVDVVVAAGGDGTINEVINGLKGRDIPLAIVPLGTANVLAAEIGLPLRASSIAKTIARAPARRVYLGDANGRRFVMMAGVGFDAWVVATLNPAWKRVLGRTAYVARMVVGLARYRFPKYRVTIDGQAYKAASVVIANGHYYGGRFTCAPDARLDDPDLKVCLFRRGGPLAAVVYALWLGLGRLHKRKDVMLVPGRSVRVEGPDAEPVQGDGDLVASLPLTAGLDGDGLLLVMPAHQ
ncbi:MAG: diacylglycerol kinase family lipid kinase [Rhodobacterales bacterium]|nr:diacylglycerol kinase family lipid kinase [Rhodobacterales bacterium]